jgi:hypothetical protein
MAEAGPVINETAAGRYLQLAGLRDPYLKRGREISKLTIPSLLPESGHTATSNLYQTFQSVGARGVNNLASKLLLSLLPPNSPFFRLAVDDFVLEQAKLQGGDEAATEIQKGLARYERAVMDDIETKADRVALGEAMKHLLIPGNVLLHDDEEVGLRVFHLDSFVCKRDPRGNLVEIVVKESVAPTVLPEEVREAAMKDAPPSTDPNATVDIYTWIKRVPRQWTIHQEVTCGEVIPGSRGTYPLDALPWHALRMVRIAGEDYGRGYVEEFYGDLKSLEGLSKAIVEGTAAAAKVLILVNPNGTTKKDTLSQAPNGAIREGNAEDVSVVQMEKFNDFRVALETISRIENRLAQAFLLNSSIQRDAERVTAEEIRLMATELETSLGGIYSVLSQEFQLPYIRVKLKRTSGRAGWPKLPKGIVKPKIVTGLEALGRSQDRNKLVNFLATLGQAIGPEQLAKVVHLNNLVSRLATMDGIDTDGLIRSVDELAQADQQIQLQALIEKLGPKAMDLMRQAAQGAPQAA